MSCTEKLSSIIANGFYERGNASANIKIRTIVGQRKLPPPPHVPTFASKSTSKLRLPPRTRIKTVFTTNSPMLGELSFNLQQKRFGPAAARIYHRIYGASAWQPSEGKEWWRGLKGGEKDATKTFNSGLFLLEGDIKVNFISSAGIRTKSLALWGYMRKVV